MTGYDANKSTMVTDMPHSEQKQTPWYHNHRIQHVADNLLGGVPDGTKKKEYALQWIGQGARGLNCLLFHTMEHALSLHGTPRQLFPKRGDIFDDTLVQNPEMHFWIDMTRDGIDEQHNSEALGDPFDHPITFLGQKPFMDISPGERLSPLELVARFKSFGEKINDDLCVDVADYLHHKINKRQKSFPYVQNTPPNSVGHKIYDNQTLPVRPSIVSRYTP